MSETWYGRPEQLYMVVETGECKNVRGEHFHELSDAVEYALKGASRYDDYVVYRLVEVGRAQMSGPDFIRPIPDASGSPP